MSDTSVIDYGKAALKARKFINAEVVAVSKLSGTLTGSADGTMENVSAINLNTSDTYSDSAVNAAVNAAITSLNLQLKELQVKVNELIDALKS